MTLRDFIRQNRAELDSAIQSVLKRPGLRLNDKDRSDWIANDESLYTWARQSGVRL